MSPEFNLIEQFFTKKNHHTDLSIGDDAALFQVTPEHQLTVSTDMLVSGTHFYPDTDPKQLGWKALAVNLSDLAAMGAQAKWATLALSLPAIDHDWLNAFSAGFFECANAFNIDLIGGDTTKGPLTLSVTIMGETPQSQALSRAGAQANDDIWVSGELGNAAIGLRYLQGDILTDQAHYPTALAALHTPQPRNALGLALRGIATSCIDISDGLMADLSHCLKASKLAATIELSAIPVHDSVAEKLEDNEVQQCILAGGEDYELCFTTPADRGTDIAKIATDLAIPITRIGHTHTAKGEYALTIMCDDEPLVFDSKGYDHFA